jgi:general secretion pathway protein D
LSQYSITGVFSPEVAPGSGATGGTTGGTTTGSTGATGTVAPPFNLNTITRGISAADFYMAVPSAIVRFLESDSQTKLVAKPQLRGQEGQKITLNLGDQIPIAQTTFGSFGGAGSIASTPVSSYTYKDVGINVEVTPRVTFDGDVVLELVVENSALGQDVNIAGQNYPSFASRKVETKIRLRDGESTLLAGLLREDERRTYKGFPGLMHLPVFRQLFSSNDLSSGQTDIVILMTPHIVRGHELTQQDVDPVYIGTQQNLGLTGPPPLIAAPPEPASSPEVAPPQGGVVGQPAPGQPAGTLPAPGIMPMPAPAAPAAPTPAERQPQASEAPPLVQPELAPTAAPPETTTEGAGAVRLLVTAPGSEFRLGGGPYTVPISVASAPRVNALTVTVTFNPAVLKVRSVEPGSFMRQGGVNAQFTQQVDAVNGRVDVTVTRSGDVIGATGSGLVAAVLFDPVAAGATIISAAGAATGPGGAALTVQATPAGVMVK